MPPGSEGPLDAIDAAIKDVQKSRLEQAEALLRECERAHAEVTNKVRYFEEVSVVEADGSISRKFFREIDQRLFVMIDKDPAIEWVLRKFQISKDQADKEGFTNELETQKEDSFERRDRLNDREWEEQTP